MREHAHIGVDAARARLGVPPGHDEHALRAAFREAAKRAHPDRPGGDAAEFRAVIEAYNLLRALPAPPQIIFPPATTQRPSRPIQPAVEIDAVIAFTGGEAVVAAADGRTLRLTLPAGLREGDQVRAGDETFAVRIKADRRMLVRGDDIWLTAAIPSRLLNEGGRIKCETPLGPRAVWINRRAGERRLVRIPGEGLPARGSHGRGHLFLRLEAEGEPSESVARTLLKRFAAAWAA